MTEVISYAKKQMEKAIDHLKQELSGLRSGRANPAMVETVVVEVYGTEMKLRDIATVSIPEPRQIMITPFDAGNVAAIVRGVDKANLNLQAKADGPVVRISIPEMDESVRLDMKKQARDRGEKTKVAVRQIRRECNDRIRGDKELPEDRVKGLEKEIQEQTDRFCKLVGELVETKEKEIMTV